MAQNPAQKDTTDTFFTLRPARRSDRWAIRALVLWNRIIPFNLRWQCFTIAEDRNGKVIGCCQFKTYKDGSCEMASIAVRKAYRSRGIASTIVRSMLAQRTTTVWGRTFPRLRALSERLGFVEVEDYNLMPPALHRLKKRNTTFNKLSPIKFGLLIIRYDP